VIQQEASRILGLEVASARRAIEGLTATEGRFHRTVVYVKDGQRQACLIHPPAGGREEARAYLLACLAPMALFHPDAVVVSQDSLQRTAPADKEFDPETDGPNENPLDPQTRDCMVVMVTDGKDGLMSTTAYTVDGKRVTWDDEKVMPVTDESGWLPAIVNTIIRQARTKKVSAKEKETVLKMLSIMGIFHAGLGGENLPLPYGPPLEGSPAGRSGGRATPCAD
jgi:hypothetical protein